MRMKNRVKNPESGEPEGLELSELLHLLRVEKDSRTPKGLVFKEGKHVPNVLQSVSEGDFVVITHSKGFKGKSGMIAVARAVSGAMNIGFDKTVPKFDEFNKFGVAIDDVEIFPGIKYSALRTCVSTNIPDKPNLIDGQGWKYTHVDLEKPIRQLIQM